MQLSQLIGQKISADVEITHLTDDSRNAVSGGVVVLDVNRMPSEEVLLFFAEKSQAKGAIVVANVKGKGIVYTPEVGLLLSRYAKEMFPTQPENLVAVTGTNGKTSIAHFYRQLAQLCGKKAASIGTLGTYVNEEKMSESGYTTPQALQLHPMLEELKKKKVTHACLEVSSHALHQHRVDGCTFKAAALTNITPEHGDYHGSWEAYIHAKFRLFDELLPEDALVAVNANKPEGIALLSLCKEKGLKALTCGAHSAELVVRPTSTPQGMEAEVLYENIKEKIMLPLIGHFQAENLAQALALGVGSGLNFKKMISVAEKLGNVPGRMELISAKGRENTPAVVVDYAHTADALRATLQAARSWQKSWGSKGKLSVVFGCGGERDKTKRPLMGQVASEFADVCFVTDDNPRNEAPEVIRSEVKAAFKKLKEIADRKAAIFEAIEQAGEGDVVVIAGKGHEKYQLVGNEKIPFDDVEVAKEALK